MGTRRMSSRAEHPLTTVPTDKHGSRGSSTATLGFGSRRSGSRLDELAGAIFERRTQLPRLLRATGSAARFADDILTVLFPHFSDGTFDSASEVGARLEVLVAKLTRLLAPLAPRMPRSARETADAFVDALPEVYESLWLDAQAICDGDPAATSVDEVISAYPGFLAIAIYRIAHVFAEAGVPVFPRLLTEHAHQRTAVDIHPRARIGRSFCIDHGTGVVIGETTVIGDQVKLYQGVTLGALSVDKSLSGTKRHPTIEDRVVIYANATILGGGTRIGHDSIIGGNVWLTESVAPYSTVYHANKVRVRSTGRDIDVSDRPSDGGAET